MSSDLERQRAASLATKPDRAVKLSGTGRVADDLYLLAHHETTGRPHLQPRVLGLGLAGGPLSEPMRVGTIRVWRGLVLPGSVPSPDDEVRAAMAAVTSEREHPRVRDWLLFLARTATADVASQLGEAGFLTRAATLGRWLGPTPRWVKE